ncbi:unnamed protein product, partial [Rangifer tarandus platyrhynchus]
HGFTCIPHPDPCPPPPHLPLYPIPLGLPNAPGPSTCLMHPTLEYWSGLPFPSPGDLLTPGIKPGSPALQADSLLPEPSGKPLP